MRSVPLLGFLVLAAASGAMAGARAGGFGSGLRIAFDGVSDAGAAARQAASMSGGRVVDIQTRDNDSHPVYNVRVLTNDGRVKVIQIHGKPAGGRGRERE